MSAHVHTNLLVALAGQPNCGKSTIFNLLTGARQHVANFPGVTVEKKQGTYRDGTRRIEVVDLPGTYSLTSYTQEERVARDFLLLERPEVVVAVVDASNLERHLYLVFQLREMRVPMILCLNMIDVAQRRKIRIDTDALSAALGIPVVATNGKSGQGGEALRAAIREMVGRHDHNPDVWRVDYGPLLEPVLEELTEGLQARPHLMEDFPARWLAVKLLENDQEAKRIVEHHTHDAGGGDLVQDAESRRQALREEHRCTPEKVIATARYKTAARICQQAVTRPAQASRTLTDRIDAIALHRVLAPLVLAVVLYLFYQIAMGTTPLIGGTWWADTLYPVLWEPLKGLAESAFPPEDPIRAGLVESLVVDGLVGGMVAILYYVPLFFVLFALLAALEDSGYMARVAFILDRLLRWFGLHGQSTLPMILGGVIAGGCCVPGVLATRAMKDERARLVTILIMPLMNCLAKMPFYILIVGLMIPVTAGVHWGGEMLIGYRGLALLGISFFSFTVALLVAKVFNHTIVSGEPAPFVMELPVYHMPTLGGVIRRSTERVILFLTKIVTVVAVVQVVVWFFITFPGIGMERELAYDREHDAAKAALAGALLPGAVSPGSLQHAADPYTRRVGEPSFLHDLAAARKAVDEAQTLPFWAESVPGFRMGDEDAEVYRQARLRMVKDNLGDPVLFRLANRGRTADGTVDLDAQRTLRVLRTYERTLGDIRRRRASEQLTGSFAGQIGHALEGISSQAGMDWRMNIAILASFAAKENFIGTLGTIYSSEAEGAQGISGQMQAAHGEWTVWHKLAILVFVALFPPCLATIIVIRTEANSWAWAIFATVYPIVLGFLLAAGIFQLGPLLTG